jgi:hypothetical protein
MTELLMNEPAYSERVRALAEWFLGADALEEDKHDLALTIQHAIENWRMAPEPDDGDDAA